jgi:hypothetical protein
MVALAAFDRMRRHGFEVRRFPLGVSLGRVTDEMDFTQDLGADWLDRLAPMMAATRCVVSFGWCPVTRQPIDLQLYVDDATSARIWSNAVRFRCPHCIVKHETKVERLASGALSLEPPQRRGARDRQAAGLLA